jgi:hypothetical protein
MKADIEVLKGRMDGSGGLSKTATDFIGYS